MIISTRLVHLAVLVSAVGAGLMAGLLFAFSTSVLPGLERLPDAQAVAAMQSFNKTILNPVFLLLFVGSTGAAAVVAVLAPFSRDVPGGWLRLAGALLFVVGVFVVTGAANVPLNDRLATVDPTGPDVAAEWAHFVGRWVVLNNVRTLAASAAATLLTVSLLA